MYTYMFIILYVCIYIYIYICIHIYVYIFGFEFIPWVICEFDTNFLTSVNLIYIYTCILTLVMAMFWVSVNHLCYTCSVSVLYSSI